MVFTTTNVSTVTYVQDDSWRCEGKTKRGTRCLNYRVKGKVFCWLHHTDGSATEGGD